MFESIFYNSSTSSTASKIPQKSSMPMDATSVNRSGLQGGSRRSVTTNNDHSIQQQRRGRQPQRDRSTTSTTAVVVNVSQSCPPPSYRGGGSDDRRPTGYEGRTKSTANGRNRTAVTNHEHSCPPVLTTTSMSNDNNKSVTSTSKVYTGTTRTSMNRSKTKDLVSVMRSKPQQHRLSSLFAFGQRTNNRNNPTKIVSAPLNV